MIAPVQPAPATRNGEFKSGRQVVVGGMPTHGGQGHAKLSKGRRQADEDFDLMLRDPTIKLAVDVIISMMMRQPWNIEGDDPDICDFVWVQMEPYKKKILRSAFRGLLKDGWRVMESRFAVEYVEFRAPSLRQTITGLKALKSSKTEILVEEETGEYVGVENRNQKGQGITIDKVHTLFVNFDEEGYDELGEPLLRVPQDTWRKWNTCDAGAQRYDDKVAGGFTFIQYPVGATPHPTAESAPVDNSQIMIALGESFKAAGYGGVPVDVDPETGETVGAAWKMEHIAAAGSLQPSFIARLKYLDALKLRAFGIPERAATEGTFGTKAEAEAHADIAILVNEERHERIVGSTNAFLVEPFNQSNFGDAGACRLVMGKLSADDRLLFQTIFTGLMADPVFGEQIVSKVDVAALLDKLNIPMLVEESFSEAPDQS